MPLQQLLVQMLLIYSGRAFVFIFISTKYNDNNDIERERGDTTVIIGMKDEKYVLY